jgi:hypothetical protein
LILGDQVVVEVDQRPQRHSFDRSEIPLGLRQMALRTSASRCTTRIGLLAVADIPSQFVQVA